MPSLSPGHGKALVSAYLIGSKGGYRHAALLGLIVTIVHTGSVFLLGIIFLIFSDTWLPEEFTPYMSLISGALILFLGVYMFVKRLKDLKQFNHGHHHEIEKKDVSFKSLLIMGISGGMVPCPSAMAVMLLSISLNRIVWGIILVGIFSLGLAVVLIVLGFFAVGAASIFKRIDTDSKLFKLIPVVSSIIIMSIGTFIFLSSLKLI